jgi:hypothetical protein
MPRAAIRSSIVDGTPILCFGTPYQIESFFNLLSQRSAPMRSSDCRKYADQCIQIAGEVAPEYRARLLALADEWREAAARLEVRDTQSNNQQYDGS